MAERIGVSVLVVTKNAGPALDACLAALHDFDDVTVIDSNSHDGTAAIAEKYQANFIPFTWNGRYPKKRQWCLDHVPTKHGWILFVDADEIMTPELNAEIRQIMVQPCHDAYYLYGQPIFCGHVLKHGRWNNKIVLARKDKIDFPVIDDADQADMGEIEGHYQPLVKGRIGQLRNPLLHACAESLDHWIDRHQRYAAWEAAIALRRVDLPQTNAIKRLFRHSSWRPLLAFIDSYVLKTGFRDGRPGLHYALARAWYYWLVNATICACANTAGGMSGAAKTPLRRGAE